MNMHLTNLTASNASQVMSSVEIAERTGKEHRNVMRDIREQLGAVVGEGGLLRFEHSYLNAQNKLQPCYHLPKRECLILVSGYSVELRAAIIDRWAELEAAVAPNPMQLLTDPAALRTLLLGYAERAMELEVKVKELAPKAASIFLGPLGK